MTDWRLAEGGGESGPQQPGFMSATERLLFERRTILLNGRIDEVRGNSTAAALLGLDAIGPEPIEMRVSAESDSLDVALTLMDTIDGLSAPVSSTVIGTVSGTMVGVVAVCHLRRIGPLGSIVLREPRADFAGVASDLHRQAVDLQKRLEAFVRRLALATGRPFEHVEADLRSGLHLGAPEALAYGLVDVLAGPR